MLLRYLKNKFINRVADLRINKPMSSEIIVKEKTKIAPNSNKTDILTFYGVPECLDKITEKEKKQSALYVGLWYNCGG